MNMLNNIIQKKSNFENLSFNQMFEMGYLTFYVIPRFISTTHFTHASHEYIREFLSRCNTRKSVIFFDSYIEKNSKNMGFFVLPLITQKPQQKCTLNVPSFRSSEGHIPYETPSYITEISSIDEIYYHISIQFRKVAVNLLNKNQYKKRLVRNHFNNIFDIDQLCRKMVNDVVSFAELNESCFSSSRNFEKNIFMFHENNDGNPNIQAINISFDGFHYHEGIHYAKYISDHQQDGENISLIPFMEDHHHGAIYKDKDLYFFEKIEDALSFENYYFSRVDVKNKDKDNINDFFIYKNIKHYAEKFKKGF